MNGWHCVVIGLCAATAFGCDQSQDLGGGDDDGAGAFANGGQGGDGTGNDGTGNEGTGLTGATGTGGEGTGLTGTGGDGTGATGTGGDGTGGDGGLPPDPCDAIPGYPTSSGVWAEITGGGYEGTYAVGDASCGTAGSGFPPILTGKFVSSAVTSNGNGNPTKQIILGVQSVAVPPTPGTYPLHSSFADFGPQGFGISPDSYTTAGPLAIYPSVNGQGSCTITVDQAKTTCMRATFSCIGLVGIETSEAIAIANGVIVCD